MTLTRHALCFAATTIFACAAASATTVRIHYDAGARSMQVARQAPGQGAWRAATAARKSADGVWTYHWPDAQGAIDMKPLLGGAPSTGGAYHLARGATVDIYPFFGPATGKVTLVADVASPQLHNSRTLRIYTPPSYDENPAKRYPVLYMHDGQNLFDPKTAAYGMAWQIATTIDKLVAEGRMAEVIVVGIDNTKERMAEYTPCCDPQYGGGGLAAYEAFIVDTVKPLIDQRLRTLPDRAHTAIMGSSLGGIASVLIASHHPEVFSAAAGLSSSFWWNRQALVKQPPARLPVRFYIDAGAIDDGLADTAAMRDVLQKSGYVLGRDLMFHADPRGRHNETSWASRVDLPLTWFFPWNAEVNSWRF